MLDTQMASTIFGLFLCRADAGAGAVDALG